MTKTIETWERVPGFEHFYEASTKGCMRSLVTRGAWRAGRIFVGNVSKPYARVWLTDENGLGYLFRLNRILCWTFYGPPAPGQYARHIDDDPSNNKIENLRWGSPKQNHQDMVDNGNRIHGERHPGAVLNAKAVRRIRKLLSIGQSRAKVGAAFGVAYGTVQAIAEGRTWRHVR